MNDLQPGFHFNVPAVAYHADPAPVASLSSSIARTLISKSPLHAFAEHPRLGASKIDTSTEEMDFGELAHRLVLGRGDDIAVFESDSWRGKEASAFWDDAKKNNKIPALRKTLARASLMALQVMLNIKDHWPEAPSEVVGIWKEGGSWCRLMADRLLIDDKNGRAHIYEFKTVSQSAHPKACASRVASMHYDLQRAHYIQGVQALRPDLAGRIGHTFIFSETTAPFATTIAEIDGEWSCIGLSKWTRALNTWKECMESGIWPSYGNKLVRLEPPPWALNAEMGAE